MKRLLATSLFAAGAYATAARVLAWCALIATTVLLALVVESLAASALGAPEPAGPPVACQSTPGAALADGDDVRARFLAELCRTAIAPHPGP